MRKIIIWLLIIGGMINRLYISWAGEVKGEQVFFVTLDKDTDNNGIADGWRVENRKGKLICSLSDIEGIRAQQIRVDNAMGILHYGADSKKMFIPVTPGNTYTFSFIARKSGEIGISPTFGWYSTDDWADTKQVGQHSIRFTAESWSEDGISGVAPEKAHYLIISFWIYGEGKEGIFWLTEAKLTSSAGKPMAKKVGKEDEEILVEKPETIEAFDFKIDAPEGFEKDTDGNGVADGWYIENLTGSLQPFFSQDRASGFHSQGIKSISSKGFLIAGSREKKRFIAYTPPKPASSYTLSFNTKKTEGVAAYARLKWYDSFFKELGEFKESIPLSSAWVKGEIRDIVFAPQIVKYISVDFYMEGSEKGGILLLDDVFLSLNPPVPEMEKLSQLSREDEGKETKETGKIFSVRYLKGTPAIFINDEPTFSTMYMIGSYNPIWSTKFMKEFADIGSHFYQTMIRVNWKEVSMVDIEKYPMHERVASQLKIDQHKLLDEKIKSILEADPEAVVLIRLELNVPRFLFESYANEGEIGVFAEGIYAGRNPDGKNNVWYAGHSFASERWRNEISFLLKRLINHVESSNYRDHIMGYILFTGDTGEWNYWGSRGGSYVHTDFSPAMTKAFRRWVSEKYEGDVVRLREAWKDPAVNFDTLEIPAVKGRLTTDYYNFRDPAKSRYVQDYYRCFAEVIVENIELFSNLVKEASNNRVLVGVFYGYFWQMTCGNTTPYALGHFAFKKILRNPNIDFICSPFANEFCWKLGGHAHSRTVLDSMKIHRKIWFGEHDRGTHLFLPWEGRKPVDGDPKNAEDSVTLLKRDFGYVLCTASYWWLWDQVQTSQRRNMGAFSDPEILKTLQKMQEIGKESLGKDRSSIAEIAVILSEESFYYQGCSRELNFPLIYEQQLGLGKLGTPYDVYMIDDLEQMSSYKLYIFLNAFYINDEQKKIIEKKIKTNGKTVVWVYAPGFIEEEGLSAENIFQLTGIKIAREERKSILTITLTNSEHSITKDIVGQKTGPVDWPPNYYWINQNKTGPVFYSPDSTATTLGVLDCNQLPGFVIKSFNNWNSIYMTSPNISPAVLRGIARYAGCHIYSDNEDDVIYANKSYLAIHIIKEGKRTINLPDFYNVYDIFDEKTVVKNKKQFDIEVNNPTTIIYLLEKIR